MLARTLTDSYRLWVCRTAGACVRRALERSRCHALARARPRQAFAVDGQVRQVTSGMSSSTAAASARAPPYTGETSLLPSTATGANSCAALALALVRMALTAVRRSPRTLPCTWTQLRHGPCRPSARGYSAARGGHTTLRRSTRRTTSRAHPAWRAVAAAGWLLASAARGGLQRLRRRVEQTSAGATARDPGEGATIIQRIPARPLLAQQPLNLRLGLGRQSPSPKCR